MNWLTQLKRKKSSGNVAPTPISLVADADSDVTKSGTGKIADWPPVVTVVCKFRQKPRNFWQNSLPCCIERYSQKLFHPVHNE